MRHKVFTVVAVILMLLPMVAFGQLKEQLKPQSFSQILTQPRGLVGVLGLDPNRFRMQHSYSLSYISLGGHGFSQGVYLNTMSYRFSDPLQVSLQWGIMNQPLGSFGVPSLYQSGVFLSGASMEYKPSRNLSIGLQFNNVPASFWYYPYGRQSYDLVPPPNEERKDR
ncbi:MAG: hypothetical protein ONB44_20845 [candidate division KSB1 bacterium]|nr:hypothetical protein [candidate division KSB1 bacterium]MDZ7304581.1 hypothetical protein [candidate division KSB1 bacterium]MDZ7313624.1 hypothetical protein [candidate division KSB1 bacterium]